MHRIPRIASIVVLFWCCCVPAAAADMVVVVSADSPPVTLDREQVVDIFLGKTRTFPDGRRAVPVDHPEGSAGHDAFYASFAGRTPAQLKAHWSKIIFTGRGQPPKQLADVELIKRALDENPDVIAYLPSDMVDERLRIVGTQ